MNLIKFKLKSRNALNNCHNYYDFRKLAKKKIPSPIFHYIDGAAEDEVTYDRNNSAFNDIDLIPNVLRGVENIDLSTTIFGKKLDLPIYCSPTALQRLFHHEGERAVAKASKEFGENSVSELQNGLEISELSIQQGETLENYKGIKRDSSLLPIQAVNQIFTLPKSKSGEAFGYSIAQNGDTFIFRLDDVTPGSVSVTDEEKQSITDFLSQQKITSELAELQVYLEDSLSVQKLN